MTSTSVARGVAAAGLLFATARSVQAQSCVGLPSMAGVAANVSTIADAYGSERSLLGRVGLTSSRVFGGVQGGYIGYKVQDPNRGTIGADLGMTVKLGNAPKPIELCPFVQAAAQLDAWQFGERVTHSMVGLSLGQEFRLGSRFALAPFVDGALARWGYRFSVTAYHPDGGQTATFPVRASELGGRYGAGFGLRVGRALTVRPSFHLVSGFRDGGNSNQPGATLSVTYSFRHR